MRLLRIPFSMLRRLPGEGVCGRRTLRCGSGVVRLLPERDEENVRALLRSGPGRMTGGKGAAGACWESRYADTRRSRSDPLCSGNSCRALLAAGSSSGLVPAWQNISVGGRAQRMFMVRGGRGHPDSLLVRFLHAAGAGIGLCAFRRMGISLACRAAGVLHLWGFAFAAWCISSRGIFGGTAREIAGQSPLHTERATISQYIRHMHTQPTGKELRFIIFECFA